MAEVKNMKKKILALGLSLCLGISMLSVRGIDAHAEEAAGGPTVQENNADNIQDGSTGYQEEGGSATDDGSLIEGQGNTKDAAGNPGGATEDGIQDSGTEAESAVLGSGEALDENEAVQQPDAGGNEADQQPEQAAEVTPVEIQCMDEEGNIYYITDDVSPSVDSDGIMARAGGDQVVNLRVKQNGTVVNDITVFQEYGTGTEGYLYGQMGADAAYLGTEGGKVKFMVSGVIGLVNASEVQVVNKDSVGSVSSYYADGANIIHRISSNLNSQTTSALKVGPQQSYMSTGATYYSYDGNYFYTNYSTMLFDYRNGTRANSINPTTPYYNYFQFLPLRSRTNYTAAQLNSKISAKAGAGSGSKMLNTGSSLIGNQDTYGVNALIMTGIAANESGWGKSGLAMGKNNLFGLNAVDSSPTESADTFSSPEVCIKNFAEGWMSKKYLNPNAWNYYGGFLGNKASGINVKYASDPYWGEKAANIAWNLDSESLDRHQYTIGIKDTMNTKHTDVAVRKESSASSANIYTTGNQSNHAFIVLEEENGFYRVQSDGVLNSSRTGIDNSSGKYNASSMYGYVQGQSVSIVSGEVENSTMFAVAYSTHVQTYGWLGTAKNGESSGTEGQAKRMEAVKIQLKNAPYAGSVEYRAYAQTYGWLDWVRDNAEAGTVGKGKRLEALQIKLTGEMAKHYDIYYRVHAQTFGWMGWAKNGENAGSADYAKRVEALQIVLVEKGGKAPGSTADAFKQRQIQYRTHVQTYGWQGYAYDGGVSGTTGLAKRLEGIEISLKAKPVSGSVRYKTHVQTYGWQDWASEGTVSGTTGQAKRLEAIQIELTGEMAKKYDIYYRVHSQTYGWLGWAQNGGKAGTAGYAKRLESIQIVLVDKGGAAPGSTEKCYLEK